jgi:hypothetical protein
MGGPALNPTEPINSPTFDSRFSPDTITSTFYNRVNESSAGSCVIKTPNDRGGGAPSLIGNFLIRRRGALEDSTFRLIGFAAF